MAAVTWNPSDKNANVTLSGGNLTADTNLFSIHAAVRATLGRAPTAGKFYFEVLVTSEHASVGLTWPFSALGGEIGSDAQDYGFYFEGSAYHRKEGGFSVVTSDSGSYSPPFTVMVAVDFGAHKLWFGYNGTWAEGGNPAAGTGALFSDLLTFQNYVPAWSGGINGAPSTGVGRFAATAFVYTPPTGFAPWEPSPTNAAIATAESSDIARLAVGVLPASLGAVEGSDGAALAAARWRTGAIGAAEASDRAGVAARATTGARIATTEASDRAAINRAAPLGAAFVRRRFGILLYEPLPLRKSAALGASFAEEFVLAHRYGDLTSGRFKLERMTATKFFAADHPMGIAEAFIDAQRTAAWEARLESDAEGHTWTVVEFAAPVPPEAAVSATGTGKRNPRTGALIENPADIAEDVMRIAGRTDAWWDQLRAESAAAGLRLAGSIEEAKSIRVTLDKVLESAAAIWAPGMARLYPVSEVTGYIGELDKMRVEKLSVRASLDNTADVLRLYYDPDKAGARSQHYIELTANPPLFGGLAATLSFDWLRTPANAEAVARRVLPWMAGERYEVGFDCGDLSVRPGQWRRLVGHPEWPFPGGDPTLMIVRVSAQPNSRTVQCFGYALLYAPSAEVTAHSVGLPTTRDAGVEVEVKNGVATLIVADDQDRPVFEALVSLDGGPPKKTDASGAVSFPAEKGEHRLAVQAPGKVANVLTITL